MSHHPEDSELEEALRRDLPSTEAEARVRRRLLAAGVAVGNGIATTTAAAAGGASSGGAATGLVANVLGLSWGVKLGVAAAVAIPTLGLWLEGQSPPAPSVVQAATPTRPRSAVEPSVSRPVPVPVAAPSAQAPTRFVSGNAERATPRHEAAVVAEPALAPRPSQSEFAAVPAPEMAIAPTKSSLADETRLLDGAFAALASGNRELAARLIGEHEARYPQGLLTKERERAKIRLSELSRGP